MRVYKTLQGQSFYDVAIAVFGNATLASSIAFANDMCVTDYLVPGTVLNLPDADKDSAIVDALALRAIVPATSDHVFTGTGIGYDTIELDLTVF